MCWRGPVSLRCAIRLSILCALALFGCGPDLPTTYPVEGKVQFPGGDLKLLHGSNVEAALVNDRKVRASGEIGEDGGFKLQTLYKGQVLPGAIEGKYQVRILLNDDNRKRQWQAYGALAPRFMKFDESGLSFDVPASGTVTLVLAPPR